MKQLILLVNALEVKIPFYELQNDKISTASVGWQIAHCLLVINKITIALQNPKTEQKWTFNLKKILILNIFKKIPKGKAKAPKLVQPQGAISLTTLNRELTLAKENLKLLNKMDRDLFFEHPYFGALKVDQTIHFLAIHTKHHLKIIQDIIVSK